MTVELLWVLRGWYKWIDFLVYPWRLYCIVSFGRNTLDEDIQMNTPYKPHLDNPDTQDRCAQATAPTTALKLARPLRESWSSFLAELVSKFVYRDYDRITHRLSNSSRTWPPSVHSDLGTVVEIRRTRGTKIDDFLHRVDGAYAIVRGERWYTKQVYPRDSQLWLLVIVDTRSRSGVRTPPQNMTPLVMG